MLITAFLKRRKNIGSLGFKCNKNAVDFKYFSNRDDAFTYSSDQ